MAHSKKVLSIYPGGVQRKDEKRVFVMNTLFNLAETFLIAALIDFFDKQVIGTLKMTMIMICNGHIVQHGMRISWEVMAQQNTKSCWVWQS